MIYVTHDQVEAMTMADEIVVLNEGRVMQVGQPMDLYHQPQSEFVAGFIGSPAMNIVDANSSLGQELGTQSVPRESEYAPNMLKSQKPGSRQKSVSRSNLAEKAICTRQPRMAWISWSRPMVMIRMRLVKPCRCDFHFIVSTGLRPPAMCCPEPTSPVMQVTVTCPPFGERTLLNPRVH